MSGWTTATPNPGAHSHSHIDHRFRRYLCTTHFFRFPWGGFPTRLFVSSPPRGAGM